MRLTKLRTTFWEYIRGASQRGDYVPPHNRKQAVLESSLGGEREAYDGLALQGFIGVEAAIRELERERKKIAGVISMLKRIQLPRLYSGQADHRRLIRPALRQRLRPASPE